jgi:hypothetical protein
MAFPRPCDFIAPDIGGFQEIRANDQENDVTIIDFAVDLAVPVTANRDLPVPPFFNYPPVTERSQVPF